MDEQQGVKTVKNEIFHQLKPTCIELSQLALQYDGQSANLRALEIVTSRLRDILKKCSQFSRRESFDDKIADYVFFPLSHIFRSKEKRSDKLVDVTLQCVRILLRFGWKKRRIDPALSIQLLILFTFLASRDDAPVSSSEEVQDEALGAVQDLFESIDGSPAAAAALIHSNHLPALGQCMTTLLDGVKDGPASNTQEQALLALRSAWRSIKEPDVLTNFLPGTVSALTKSLMPTTRARRSRKVLILSMQVLERVLVSLLGDVPTRHIRREKPADESTETSEGKIDASWLRATAAQIKLALANIIKLRDHDDIQVRCALKHLCIVVLDECHESLSESASMMVETWMTLAITEEPDHDIHTSLADLAILHPSIAELIKNTAYNWVSSLPRVLQSNDESAKHRRIQQISSSCSLMSDLDIDSEFLSSTLTQSLTKSVGTVLEAERVSPGKQGMELVTAGAFPLSSVTIDSGEIHFNPVIMPHLSQKQNREDFLALMTRLGTAEALLKMASETMNYMRTASGIGQLAAYWLSFNLIKAAERKSNELDAFIILESQGDHETLLELYSFSAELLAGSDAEPLDWRLQAIAIEIVAYAAQSQKTTFRPELVDVLYPIVQLIGSTNIALREHAMTGVTILAAACGYPSTSHLIVENVDYMVNAISLRLNTFDISPQAPRVLITMIRLAGPALLPFLDDVVGSIFAALDNFHGYAPLVEALFLVLSEVVSAGAKVALLPIASKEEGLSHEMKEAPYPSIAEIATEIRQLRQKLTDPDPHEPHDFPREPWTSAQALLDDTASPPPDADANPPQDLSSAPPPPSKTYSMIQNITRLSQHYLTHDSPLLRRRLLDLIATASPVLAPNEDAFLPLINDIWPVLMQRLYDPEPYVTMAACAALAHVCRAAGDFLGTRLATEWPALRAWIAGAKRRAEDAGRAGRGGYAVEERVWQGVVGFMVAVVECVRVEEEMWEDVLEWLAALVGEREDVRGALEGVNADAVWLAMWRRGMGDAGGGGGGGGGGGVPGPLI